MPKQTILYTGSGDEGYTSLLGMERVAKYDLRPQAYGTVDETSAFMGLARAAPAASERTQQLILEAQRDLWILMGELAAAPGVKLPQRLAAGRVEWLEEQTTQLGQEFPPLTQFVIAGDTQIGAYLDVARTVARRAERYVAQLAHQGALENAEILRYLNRLSSLLFALARYEEHRAGWPSTLAKRVK
jgi:cob(I)alamin adenosyltransferase